MIKEFKKGENLTIEEFIRRAKLIHGENFDYSASKYINSRIKVKIRCSRHGTFYQMPSDHIRGHGCKKCHGNGIKQWSLEQDKILIENYQEKGAYWCAEKLNKTDHSVRGRANTINLSKKQRENHLYVPAFLWNSLVGRVRTDNKDLDFDRDFIWELYEKQNGKCALTGWSIVFGKVCSKNTVSVDRIDSTKGYLKENVQLTHKVVNRCKLNCPEGFFFEVCKSVYLNRKKDFEKDELIWENDVLNDTINPVRVSSESYDINNLDFLKYKNQYSK